MFHYTYKMHYSTGKYYIGVRTSKLEPELDKKYIGSSKITPNNLIVKKEILQVFNTRKEALDHEILMHKELDIAVNELYYNRSRQLSDGFDVTGTKQDEAHKNKIRNALIGQKHSEERKLNMKIGVEKAKLTRKKRIMPEEEKQRRSEALKGRDVYWAKGKVYTDEERKVLYHSRLKHKNEYEWINIDTLQKETKTCQEMAFEYGTDKNIKQFSQIVDGIAKTYLRWTLLTMYENKTYKRNKNKS